MRPASLLIVSPDDQLVAALQRSLSKVKEPGLAVILREYPSPELLSRVIHAEQPSAVLIGLSDPEAAFQITAQLLQGHPGMVVAAAHTSLASDLIVAAHRAGARDYIGPPFDPEVLESLLRRPLKNDQEEAVPGELACFLPARGGSGTSTVALHAAAAIAHLSGKRVLLADFDFHGSVLAFRLSLKPEFTLADALRHQADLDEFWNRITCRFQRLDILAPPLETDSVEPSELRELPAVLQSAQKYYQWVICDLPSPLYASSLEALVRADTIFLVSTPEAPSLQLARRRVHKLVDRGVSAQTIRLVINRFDGRSALGPKEVAQVVGIPPFCTLDNHYDVVNKAILEGRLISWESDLGKQFSSLAGQMLGLPAVLQPAQRRPRWNSLFSSALSLRRS